MTEIHPFYHVKVKWGDGVFEGGYSGDGKPFDEAEFITHFKEDVSDFSLPFMFEGEPKVVSVTGYDSEKQFLESEQAKHFNPNGEIKPMETMTRKESFLQRSAEMARAFFIKSDQQDGYDDQELELTLSAKALQLISEWGDEFDDAEDLTVFMTTMAINEAHEFISVKSDDPFKKLKDTTGEERERMTKSLDHMLLLMTLWYRRDLIQNYYEEKNKNTLS